MSDEMHSFLAGGSTSGLVKPVAYDTIEVPKIENSEIRKIAHGAQTTLPASESNGAKIIYGLPDVIVARRVMDGRLQIHTESGECEMRKRDVQALYLSAGFGDFGSASKIKRLVGE